MDLSKSNTSVVRLTALTCCLSFIAACSSGVSVEKTNPDSPITAQAIDGYIVDGQVKCDGIENGRTSAAGWLSCPAGTSLITVIGGQDVGFDETATTGGTLFTGVLQAPGDALYVTPVTSLAISIASPAGVFDRTGYDTAMSTIQDRLGLESVDLSGNPADDVELARLNVELNLLIQQFSSNSTDYGTTMQALSSVIEDSASVDMSDGVALTSALNQQLLSAAPHLSLTASEEVTTAEKLNQNLGSIESSETISQLENVINQVDTPAAFTIDQNIPMIGLVSSYYYQTYGSYNSGYRTRENAFTVSEFMSPDTNGSGYNMSVRSWDAKRLVFHSDALNISQSMAGAKIGVALNIESMLDNRHLSVAIKDVQLSMNSGDNTSITMELPQNAVLHAQYTDRLNIVTQITEATEDDLIASSADGTFIINLYEVKSQLSKYGYPDFLKQSGHYRITVVLEGIKFDLANNGDLTSPEFYTVSTGTETVSGTGIQGYFTLY